jgi:hypothetical protein
VDESGFIRDAVADEPRFDHDPVTGECLGLLIEESRVNNYHIWNSTTDTLTSITSAYIDTQTVSSVLTPRGVAATAYTATKTGNTGQYHGLGGGANSFSISSNTSVSASAYIKEFNSSDYRLLFVISAYNASTNNNRYILYRARPSTGEWISGSVDGNWSTPVIDVKDVGNGWYRFEISSTNTYEEGWDEIRFSFQLLNENNAQFYDPPTANTHGIYLSSPQYELGSFPTSYIPTNNANGSRTPDNASITGTNFSSWYRQDEGSVYVEANPGSFVAQRVICDFGANALHRITLLKGTNGNAIWFVNNGNSTQASLQFSPWNTTGKLSGVYKLNDFASSFNGSTVLSDDSGLLPENVNKMDIGKRADGGTYLNGTIKNITYYPVRLPNSQLQTLTK